MNELLNQIKKTIVFIGTLENENKPRFVATGFLVGIDGLIHLVTAKHVVIDPESGNPLDADLRVFYNMKDGRIVQRAISIAKKDHQVDWVFHDDKCVDLAIMPFPLIPEKDDAKVISDEMWLSIDRLFEVYDIFFLSYQPGIKIAKKITPIIRQGIISLINDDKTFYIDGAAFPGNSGSPVFLKPSPIRYDDKGTISLGGDKLGGKFIGVIGEYIPYQEVAISAQTGRPRITFEENTGLSKVWSVDYLHEIISSKDFQAQLTKVKERQSSPK